MKTKIEYLPMGEIAYHLDNGVTVYYYNEETPLLFKRGLHEIGRLLSTNTPYIDIIHFAAKVTAEDIEDYFS